MPRARNVSEARTGDEPPASLIEDQQAEDLGRSERVALPEAPVSRVIEYFPPEGNLTIGRDCKYGGDSYSKGSVIIQADLAEHKCSGDADGTWVKVKKPT
jgi:hypothetical protein